VWNVVKPLPAVCRRHNGLKQKGALEYAIFLHGTTAPRGPRPTHYQGFTFTLRHTTVGRTPLDKWSARRKDLCLTLHNTHNRQTFMSPARFEPVIPAIKRKQTSTLDRARPLGSAEYAIRNISWKLNGLKLHAACESLAYVYHIKRLSWGNKGIKMHTFYVPLIKRRFK
jgi:hypothetical protein